MSAQFLGGLKTKNIDVVVATADVGPCLAISVKGSLNAFRNLTNRMEEAVGDCTNIHIAYPALVYGFLHVIRANRGGLPNDRALKEDDTTVETIQRYHDALARLTGRRDIRNDLSRYECIALLLAETAAEKRGQLVDHYPESQSPLQFDQFFPALIRAYDLRFVYPAMGLRATTERLAWSPESPALTDPCMAEFTPRLAAAE